MAASLGTEALTRKCEVCRLEHNQTWFCHKCDSTYCDTCWDKIPQHGKDKKPHEKTDHAVYARLHGILDPPEDEDELRKLHAADEDTIWFGVRRSPGKDPFFHDFNRFSWLMFKTIDPSKKTPRYPQLVSFIGQTGAGKSTLIKMLVNLKAEALPTRDSIDDNRTVNLHSPVESPVVGSVRDDKSPTSGDVHLYMDPSSAYGRLPLLWADCEGLDGGETNPVANEVLKGAKDSGATEKIQRFLGGHKRKLCYTQENPEAHTRDFAVRKLYPRLLYTFSDVIVFVLRNTRTLEHSVLIPLIEWARTSLESSVNQPVLPHALIVLNYTGERVDAAEWDTEIATERLLNRVAETVNNETFKPLADEWRKKGKTITSIRDLLCCYYTDITVVRVPSEGSYMKMDAQVKLLYSKIKSACNRALKAKLAANMLSNADNLSSFLEEGFDHFTRYLDKPFNFVKMALKKNPISKSFAEHLAELAGIVLNQTGLRDGKELFIKLAPFIASCITVECLKRPGKAIDLFDDQYADACKTALDIFCDTWWPCDYTKNGERCVNVKHLHAKGHQAASGRILSNGPYTSLFSSTSFQGIFIVSIKAHLSHISEEMQARFAGQSTPDEDNRSRHVYSVHQTRMVDFYSSLSAGYNPTRFRSTITCLSCVMNTPEHPLPCGHELCTDCIRAYGTRSRSTVVELLRCPLHRDEDEFGLPWKTFFKPDHAGLRILTLDGGGMRGIMELEILQALEQALGNRIPIQAFFDLIVGTSTGGIISLGIGTKNWSVKRCISEFTGLCQQAFKQHKSQRFKAIRHLSFLRHGSKYKTTPLHESLQTALGEEEFYGSVGKTQSGPGAKVAVTASTGTASKAVVLANYTRQEIGFGETFYEFRHPHDLRVWEAGCATSAAPPYFKPFTSRQFKETYLDGAFYHNNPSHVAYTEGGLIWPDVAGKLPDVLLSLGTGVNHDKSDGDSYELARRQQTGIITYDDHHLSNSGSLTNRLSVSSFLRKTDTEHKESVPKAIFTILTARIERILDSELAWKQFKQELSRGGVDQEEVDSRLIRFDVDLGKQPPKLDEVKELPELRAKTIKLLYTPRYQMQIQDIVRKLIASSFYFYKETCVEKNINYRSQWSCRGSILCRFDSKENQRYVQALGEYFKERRQEHGQSPYFRIRADINDSDDQIIDVNEDAINRMVDQAEFSIDKISLELFSNEKLSSIELITGERHVCPISGFPRYLATEDKMHEKHLKQRFMLMEQQIQNIMRRSTDRNSDDADSRGATEVAKQETTLIVNQPEFSGASSLWSSYKPAMRLPVPGQFEQESLRAGVSVNFIDNIMAERECPQTISQSEFSSNLSELLNHALSFEVKGLPTVPDSTSNPTETRDPVIEVL